MKVLTAQEMAEIDRKTIEEVGIPSPVLMENAGRAVAEVVKDRFPDARKILCVAGKGNNGGDAIVVARLLHLGGTDTSLFLISEELSPDAELQLRIAKNVGVRVVKELPDLGQFDLIIDGLLGTGFRPPAKGRYREIIERINSSGVPVVAIDLPSGLEAGSGRVEGVFLKAHITVTFQFPKLCHLLFPASKFCGEVIVADISIPAFLARGIKRETIELKELRVPSRERDTHKNKEGHVLILGGSAGKTGAVIMSAQSATSAGAGLVTAGVPQALNPVIESALLEEMSLPLPGKERLSYFGVKKILSLQERFSALGMGMGMGRYEEGQDIVRDLLVGWKGRLLLDADALNNLSDLGGADLLRERDVPAVITPHIGEFSRLSGLDSGYIAENQTEVASAFAERWGCYIVLKGARTVIANPEGHCWISTRGTPAMAKGGTGDVLAGILTALLGKIKDIPTALKLGVTLHGIAGELAEAKSHRESVRASDLIRRLGEAYREIEKISEKTDTDHYYD